jgi:hypothetical protein
MPRNLNSKTTSSGSSNRRSSGTTSRSGLSSAITSEGGSTVKNDNQSGQSTKRGESNQLANVAARISFSIPLLGRVPVNPAASC